MHLYIYIIELRTSLVKPREKKTIFMSTIIKVQNCLKIDKFSYCTLPNITVLKGFIAYKIRTIFVFLKGYQTVASLSSERLILFQMSYFYHFYALHNCFGKTTTTFLFHCFSNAHKFRSQPPSMYNNVVCDDTLLV